ncbi:MAG: HPr kinase/phosphatase C-terminal domain-containing protein [Alphaproteobacteria bacterium]|nr:HPr kinase/phosphatase C-terminal domain-containing protein [Alphaproteobacteria bacterium]
MAEHKIIHATLISVGGKGVLLIGNSGFGKSDLALRLIESKKAKLVADDVVELWEQNGKVKGCAPQNLAGLLEVRGIGIVTYSYIEKTTVDVIVELKNSLDDIERMPLMQKEMIFGLEINKIDLYAKENSAPDKVVAALRLFNEYSAD